MDDQIAKIIKKHYPEISNGWHVPVWGVITGINETPANGSLSDEFRPYYAANVKIMTKKGKDSGIEMQNIAISSSFTESGGFLQLPDPGQVVSIQFLFGLPNKPYIDKVLPYGVSLPGIKTNELALQSREGVKVHLTQSGDIATITDAATINISAENNSSTISDIFERTNATITTNGNHKEVVSNVYQLATLGAMYLISAGNTELSALGDLTLTCGGDLNEDVIGSRIAKIKESLTLDVKGTITETSAGDSLEKIGENKQIEAKKNFEVNAKGKVSIGNDTVDVVKTLSELIDLVSKIALALSTHNHTIGTPTTAPPIQSALFAGHATLSESMKIKLMPIVK